MSKKSIKLTWVLFIFGLLCPIEILGQYAAPYLNPLTRHAYPAAINWRDKSMVGVSIDTRIDKKDLTMTHMIPAFQIHLD